MDPILSSALAILVLPLLSYILLFFFGEKLPGRGAWFGVSLMGVTLLLALRIFGHFFVLNDPAQAYEISWN